MSVIMKVIFSLSLSGSLLILVLFFAKAILKHKVSRQWQYYIWLVVIARLLLPAAPEVSVVGTVFARLNQGAQVEKTEVQRTQAQSDKGDAKPVFAPELDTAVWQQGAAVSGGAAKSGHSTGNMKAQVLQNLWIPWLFAALLLFLRRVTIYQSFVKYAKSGGRQVADIALLDRLSQLCIQTGVRRPVELYVNRLVSTPLLVGFFCPCIILPTTDLPEADFLYTIRHELTHCRRGDLFYKWLVQLTICLHWFNPLVWLMGREIDRACEFSCDEALLEGLCEQERRAYGDTLMRALKLSGDCQKLPVSVTLNESARILKQRLHAIMNFKKGTGMVRALTVVLTAALMMGATAAGAYVEPVRLSGTVEKRTEITGEGKVWPGAPADDKEQSPASDSSLEALAKRYYEQGAIAQFGAVFGALDAEAQRAWLDIIYEDRETAFFSFMLSVLPGDSALVDECAQRAYADQNVTFFSIAVIYMGDELLSSWQARAQKEDMDTVFFWMLYNDKQEEETIEQAEKRAEDAYGEWGITQDSDKAVFYYQGALVRVFYDYYEPDNITRTLRLNPNGTVDVKVTRNIRNKILSVEYMTQEEVASMFDAEDMAAVFGVEENESAPGQAPESEEPEAVFDEKEFEAASDVFRVTAEELPADAAKKMDACDIREWYVIHAGERQYIRFYGFAWSYAFHPKRTKEGWRVEIVRLQKKDYGNVLLSLPDNGQVTIVCDGEVVEFTEIWD